MKKITLAVFAPLLFVGAFMLPHSAFAALTLTSGNNATTTPNVATSITGFQIVGPSASTTPVKIHVTNGTVHVSNTSGLTVSGNSSATLNLSGTVSDLNSALSSLTYTRTVTGTDTLEVALVNANQIYFPDNGHVYQYVGSSLTWTNAKTAAEALTAYGATGYLVTITSAAENSFVKARLSGDAWIGASDAASEGDWKWVVGPEAGTSFWSGNGSGSTVGGQYASWNGGEPNDSGGNEDCGEEYVADGTWNDLPCTGTTVNGYVAEFGSGSDMPNVVSKDVSIVTADVPAVTSLSPANGATLVNPSANLVIGFSKAVTKQTGAIVIYKSSDNSVIESIDASSSKVSGSGSNTITIDPTSTLPELTQLYVTVAGTAFKDASNHFFNGITASTTWVFTTADVTAPSISSVASSTSTSSATVTWSTNEAASTRLIYSAGTSYASSSATTNTSPRVTSHSVSLSALLSCTQYNFKVVSADSSGNYATSTARSFTTTGCLGNATPSSATSTTVVVSAAATSTATDSGRTLTVSTPANFTATSSSVVIQIKGLSSNTVLGAIGKPSSGLSSAATIVFDVTALVDNVTTLDSFDTPVTISYTYTDADVSGLDETSLVMYHYHSGAWVKLNNCTVNTSTNTITCNTPSFSTFAIFGTPLATNSGSSGKGGTTIQGQVANLTALGKLDAATTLRTQWPQLFTASDNTSLQAQIAALQGQLAVLLAQYQTMTGHSFAGASSTASTPSVRDLTVGMEGDDVRQLQELLIKADTGVSARELARVGATGYFSIYTKNALGEYQEAHSILPHAGYFGSITRDAMKAAQVAGLWW